MSPPNSGGNNGASSMSPSSGQQGSRNFSSPESHTPNSANNEPLVSPLQQQQHQAFFNQSGMPKSPGSPAAGGGGGEARNSNSKPSKPNQNTQNAGGTNNGNSGQQGQNNCSILERALASTVKQETSQPNAASQPPAASIGSSTQPVLPTAGGINQSAGVTTAAQQQMPADPVPPPTSVAAHLGWPHHLQQQHVYVGPEDNFVKPEFDLNDIDYHMQYRTGGGHPGQAQPPTAHGLGPRVPGGQEDHLHSPSQYTMTAQQPPWVR